MLDDIRRNEAGENYWERHAEEQGPPILTAYTMARFLGFIKFFPR